jgi:DNA/RNA-binding domain of Phe-tRNA-synthetase-like protein
VPVTIHNRVPRDDLALGLVVAEGLTSGPAPAALAAALDDAIAERRAAPEATSARQQAVRDLLRNGKYKPTGRAKPASEYLQRAANEGTFPRINGPVDACNLVSLRSAVPISLWDLDLAATSELEFRLGAAGESYVFNASGQTLDLEDLVCGCALSAGASRPTVTPVKDSLATKLVPATTRVAAAIYWPTGAGSVEPVAAELFAWLRACGTDVRGGVASCPPHASRTL